MTTIATPLTDAPLPPGTPIENNDPNTPTAVVTEPPVEAAPAPAVVDEASSAPAFYEGIDCVTPLHWPVYGEASLWEYLGKYDKFPAFVGRYIGSSFASYNLTKEEIAFIHARGCAILVVFDGVDANSVNGDYNSGVTDGKRAGQVAKDLGIPANGTVAIYVDIESGWPVTVGYIAGFHAGLLGAGYLPGCYGNPRDPNFNNAYSGAYLATPAMQGHSYIWSSEPENTGSRYPGVYAPARPHANGANTVVWQWVESLLNNLIDRDYATQKGYDLMYNPIWDTLATCEGKPTPDHTSAGVCEIPKGTSVRRTGLQTPEWVQVITPHGFRVWILKSNIDPS